jgi:RNA polymerase sigma factor (sigma-70 family)
VDDRALVAAMVSGDLRGLEGTYRRYADRILTYCRGLLRDPQAAADAVHDTFVAAQEHIAQLRDPDRLRPWLYAIARNECLRHLRSRARQVGLDEVGDVSAPPTDPGSGVHADELRDLVWAAADGLSPGDREVFELMVRHGLGAADVAALLGVTADHAHARLSRARVQLERSLGALLVARTGRGQCPDLAGLLRGWDGRLTALLRKRITRHAESCRVCAEQRRTQMSPARLLSGYAALPFLVVPAGLWDRIRLTSGHPGAAAQAARQAIRNHHTRFEPATGFPRPAPVSGRRGRRALAVAAGVMVLLLLLCGGVLAFQRPDRIAFNPPLDAPSSAAGPVDSAAPEDQIIPGDSASPTAPPTDPEPPVEPSTGPPAPSLNLTAAVRTTCTTGTSVLRRFTLTVGAVSDGANLESAVLHWSPPADASRPMTVDGRGARTVVENLAGARVTWRVAAVTVNGARDSTPPATVPNPCPG